MLSIPDYWFGDDQHKIMVWHISLSDNNETYDQEQSGEIVVKKIIPILLLLAGCSNLYLDPSDPLRIQNKENAQKLSVGMSKQVAMEIMGTDPAKGVFMWIDNPYRSETLKGKDGKVYEVLYYYTDLKQRDDKITDDELTPLVFENGKLTGWGYPFLDQKAPPKPIYTR